MLNQAWPYGDGGEARADHMVVQNCAGKKAGAFQPPRRETTLPSNSGQDANEKRDSGTVARVLAWRRKPTD